MLAQVAMEHALYQRAQNADVRTSTPDIMDSTICVKGLFRPDRCASDFGRYGFFEWVEAGDQRGREQHQHTTRHHRKGDSFV